MRFVLFLACCAVLDAGAGAPATPAPPAEPPDPAPSIRDLRDRSPADPEAIFTYTIDGHCQVATTRKLQGTEDIRWPDASAAHAVTDEASVFRFVDGLRTRLTERRVKLLGELVRPGELVCQVRPSGEVVDAWIERDDTSTARRRTPEREPVPVRRGEIGDLGTFSLVLP